jgi:hypothetical protein
MNWNYRVIRTEDETGPCYAIHEVYYRNGEPHSWTETSVPPVSETRNGLFEVIGQMIEGIAQPVLVIIDNKLRELEPAKELSDELRRAIEQGKLLARGELDLGAAE